MRGGSCIFGLLLLTTLRPASSVRRRVSDAISIRSEVRVIEDLALDGKAVVITGGSHGIGRAMALACAEAGAGIVIAARGQERIDATVATIRAAGGRAIGLATDVTDRAQVDALVDACVREYGKIDAMFAHAGGSAGGVNSDAPFWEFPDEAYEAAILGNLTSSFYTCRAAARAMVAQGTGGSIVVTATAGALRASQRWSYGTAKGGVTAMTKMLSGRLGPQGIRCNCLIPGMIWTNEEPTERERAVSDQRGIFTPAGRVGVPADFGALGVFLASDASSYVTGQQFWVDGGMVNGGIAPPFYKPAHEI